MRVCMFLSVLLWCTLLVAFFLPVPVHAAPTWSIQTIDTTSAGAVAIAIDSDNNPHIVYGHYENSSAKSPVDVIYARWNGSNWNNQTIPFSGLFNLVLDSDNNPHIVYRGIDGLIYAWWTGSDWTQQTISKEDAHDGFLALDSAGNPHIAYTADFGLHNYPDGKVEMWNSLKYASWNGSSWDTQTVDLPGNLGTVDLALDSNDYPHTMYSNETDYFPPEGGVIPSWAVKFASWNGSAWDIQTAFSDLSAYSNMVLDSKGYPHFVYRKDYPISTSFNSTLSYASWNGSAWNTQTVVSNERMGGLDAGFLALDSYDYPHIDYINQSANSDYVFLVYGGWTGSVWDFQIVGPNSLAIYAGPIAMDSKGNAHIAYTGYSSSFRPFASQVHTMYATAPQPIYIPPPPSTQVPSSPFSTLLVVVTVTVVAVVAAGLLVYFKKRHAKSIRRENLNPDAK